MLNRKKMGIALAATVMVGIHSLVPFHTLAAENKGEMAVQQLVQQGVLVGYGDGTLKSEKRVTQAELAHMIVLSLGLKDHAGAADGLNATESNQWYYENVNKVLALGIMEKENGKFHPHAPVTQDELAEIVAKALQRDVVSVKYWMNDFNSDKNQVTRGEVAQLLITAQKSIRSVNAEIVEMQPLNKITLQIKFSAPLTLKDESLETAIGNFAFDHGLTIVNQPRLKTGSLATYIVPTATQNPDIAYTLNYKGKQAVSFGGSEEKITMNEARQVAFDTFEVDSLKEDGVVDYGYVISAYSAMRGKHALILDDLSHNQGKSYEVISSLRNRSVTITPEGEEPMVANYVGFTQSTDGKQEPKFRLPQGMELKPGVKYTVTSDWMTIKEASFVAVDTAPLEIKRADQVDASKFAVTLKEDPKDEIFAFRQVKLKGTDGTEMMAEYELQSRKGDTGLFMIKGDGAFTPGMTYQIEPVGKWAKADGIFLKVKK